MTHRGYGGKSNHEYGLNTNRDNFENKLHLNPLQTISSKIQSPRTKFKKDLGILKINSEPKSSRNKEPRVSGINTHRQIVDNSIDGLLPNAGL